MAYSVAAKNLKQNALAAVAVFASIHDGDPGDNGANEISGGSPAYIRKAVTWGAAALGVIAMSNDPVFDMPAGSVARYAGFWSAESGGTFYGYGLITEETFAAQGTYTLSSASLDDNA